MPRKPKKRERYVIVVSGKPIDVTETIYNEYYRIENHLKTLLDKDIRHGLLYIEDIPRAEVEDYYPEYVFQEQEAELRREKRYAELYRAIRALTPEERILIHILFFEDCTNLEAAKRFHVTEGCIRYRKKQVIGKLQQMMAV